MRRTFLNGRCTSVRRAAAATALFAALLLLGQFAGGAAASVGPVFVESHFPNWATAVDAQQAQQPNEYNWASKDTDVLVDNPNHLALVINGAREQTFTCRGGGEEIVKYDLDTAQRLGAGCATVPPNPAQLGFDNGDGLWAAVSSKSRVVVVGQIIPNTASLERFALTSEDSLSDVKFVCVGPVGFAISDSTGLAPCESASVDNPASPPTPPFPFVHGFTLDPVTNDLLVLTDPRDPQVVAANNDLPPLGVRVAAYRLEGVGTNVTVRLRWVVQVAPNLCQASLVQESTFGAWQTGAPFFSDNPSDPALFVPCSSGNTSLGASGATVVKIPLQGGDCMCPEPGVTGSAVAAPAAAGGFLFDPVGERGYLLPQAGTANAYGATVLVYDGHGQGSMAGRFSIGETPQKNLSGAYYFAVDPGTGRFYAEDVKNGLRVVDGRRTPITPGFFFPIVQPVPIPPEVNYLDVIQPDSDHPHTRLIVPLSTRLVLGIPRMDYLSVIADELPVSTDPPPDEADSNTFAGPVPDGAALSSNYGEAARGFGFHSDLVGGYAGVVYNSNPDQFAFSDEYPYGRSTLDVAAGVVESSTLRDGAAQGAASAFADINGLATGLYHQCTDRYSLQTCLPPNCAPNLNGQQTALDPCAPIYSALAAEQALTSPATPRPSSAQGWPYPTAECSEPGGDSSQAVDGLYKTPDHSTAPSATPAPQEDLLDTNQSVGAPVTSAFATGARAEAQCGGPFRALGRFQCYGAASTSAATPGTGSSFASASTCLQPQTIMFSSAETTSSMTPPADNGGVAETSVTASVSGVRFLLPDKATIEIGQVLQTATVWAGGRAGTARTSRTVVIHDVRTSNPLDGSSTTLCAGSGCVVGASADTAAPLLQALNALDPGHIFVSLPTPDTRFGIEADGVSPAGSPGGYLAAIEANPIEQQGDHDFNDMTRGFDHAESTLLPALRIVAYDSGNSQISREIFDFAGVEADAHLGIEVNEAIPDTAPTVDETQAMIEAGVPPVSTYIPGTTGSAAFPGQPAATDYHGGLLGVIERTLDGMSWLYRAPFAGIQMAAFLVLLGLPLLLSRRRWTWRPASREEHSK